MEQTKMTDKTALARIAQMPTGPAEIMRPLVAGEFLRYFDMARIGMTVISLYKATFDENDKLVSIETTRSTDSCSIDGSGVEGFPTSVKSDVFDKATDASGYLIQNSLGSGVYVHTADGDVIAMCTRNLPYGEDCHCG